VNHNRDVQFIERAGKRMKLWILLSWVVMLWGLIGMFAIDAHGGYAHPEAYVWSWAMIFWGLVGVFYAHPEAYIYLFVGGLCSLIILLRWSQHRMMIDRRRWWRSQGLPTHQVGIRCAEQRKLR
jgi:hypothetical protein